MTVRDQLLSQRAHAITAGFCRAGIRPEPTQVVVTAGRVFKLSPLPQNAGGRQAVIGAVGSYFSRFYRAEWKFLGAEVNLGTGRVDLVWETPDDLVVIDELKLAAFADMVDDPKTVAQAERYVDAGVAWWGELFAGVRLLPLLSPARAMWYPAKGHRMALAAAPTGVR